MCALYVGLPDVKVLAVEADRDGLFVSHVEQTCERPRCSGCGSRSGVKDRDPVELADLPCFGRPTRLVWHKVRLAGEGFENIAITSTDVAKVTTF